MWYCDLSASFTMFHTLDSKHDLMNEKLQVFYNYVGGVELYMSHTTVYPNDQA